RQLRPARASSIQNPYRKKPDPRARNPGHRQTPPSESFPHSPAFSPLFVSSSEAFYFLTVAGKAVRCIFDIFTKVHHLYKREHF
ncbi:MAG TPA: hypothetical protein VMT94_08055, partial [Burkholderiales bacterium]|nr:hypothetical protein [Burkholderiales bacterium]